MRRSTRSPRLPVQNANLSNVYAPKAAIAHVEKNYPVDAKRIYASGISQGAIESLLLAPRTGYW